MKISVQVKCAILAHPLKDARVLSGQSLEDVSKDYTGLSLLIWTRLSALIKESLPNLGYVLGFVRSYAVHLGMDAGIAVNKYKVDIECPQNLGISNSPHHVPKQKLYIPKGSFAAGMLLSCMLVVVSWYGWKSDARSAEQMEVLLPKREILGLNKASVTANDPDMISLKAIGSSWVQIKDKNGLVLASRIMVPGEIFETKRQNSPLLSLRDAGAIELYIGGKLIGPIGQKGASAKNIPLVSAVQ